MGDGEGGAGGGRVVASPWRHASTHYTMHTNPCGGTDTSDVGVGRRWRDADGGTKRREPTVSKTTTSQIAEYYRCTVCVVRGMRKFKVCSQPGQY